MHRTGLDLESTNLGTTLLACSEVMSQLADTKNQFDDAAKTEFLGTGSLFLSAFMLQKDCLENLNYRPSSTND